MGRQKDQFPYLRIDDYLKTLIGARALASALESGLIDYLSDHPGVAFDALSGAIDMTPDGLRFLVDLLKANDVAVEDADGIALSGPFREMLIYRDLLEAKIAFIDTVLPDILSHFTELLGDPQAFMAQSQVFDLFRYDRCFDITPDNIAATKRWVSYTTTLTRYETAPCLDNFDFSPYRRMLDIGGNSGEFVYRLCKAHPELSATVFDLPVVCEIGREHISGKPEAERIDFIAGDIRRDELPGGHDLICFKSFLHDWPREEAAELLRRAVAALLTGGILLIFERGPLEVGTDMPPYSMIPNLLFLHFFRPAQFYTQTLSSLGLRDINVQRIELEMPFNLISARKP